MVVSLASLMVFSKIQTPHTAALQVLQMTLEQWPDDAKTAATDRSPAQSRSPEICNRGIVSAQIMQQK
eukprot:m.201267 g.201267  ORF g.201267 m.201267 type:complete len:68 (+) comp18416_c0_seq8:323-526(+)